MNWDEPKMSYDDWRVKTAPNTEVHVLKRLASWILGKKVVATELVFFDQDGVAIDKNGKIIPVVYDID